MLLSCQAPPSGPPPPQPPPPSCEQQLTGPQCRHWADRWSRSRWRVQRCGPRPRTNSWRSAAQAPQTACRTSPWPTQHRALMGTNTIALLLTKQMVPQLSAHQFDVCLFVIAFTVMIFLVFLFSYNLTSLLVPMWHWTSSNSIWNSSWNSIRNSSWNSIWNSSWNYAIYKLKCNLNKRLKHLIYHVLYCSVHRWGRGMGEGYEGRRDFFRLV